jgi:hypothetical protein
MILKRPWSPGGVSARQVRRKSAGGFPAATFTKES